jgi:transcriptional regulator with XRE-family HTH domain
MIVTHDGSEHLGRILRQHRSRVGMTQQQLADFSTVSVRAIRDLERGATLRPRRETLRLIADTLMLDVSGRSELERAAGRVRRAPSAREERFGVHVPSLGPDRLIGREGLLDLLRLHLRGNGERLIGLTGAPGAGKTRLAAEAAATAQEEGFLLLWHGMGPTSPAWSTRHGVIGRILTTGVEDLFPDTASPSRGGLQRLTALIGDASALLVVDGMTHRPDDAALASLLQECFGLRILYTSTRPRGALAEKVLAVPPLALPEPGGPREAAPDNPSVRVLLRQGATGPVDADVARICRLLDGLPLALRSASPLLGIYGPGTLARCLAENPFDLLDSHTDPGDRSLRRRLAEAVGELDREEAEILSLVCRRDEEVSVEELARAAGQELKVCGRYVNALLAAGLIRSATPGYFRPLHLIRSLVTAYLADAVSEPR